MGGAAATCPGPPAPLTPPTDRRADRRDTLLGPGRCRKAGRQCRGSPRSLGTPPTSSASEGRYGGLFISCYCRGGSFLASDGRGPRQRDPAPAPRAASLPTPVPRHPEEGRQTCVPLESFPDPRAGLQRSTAQEPDWGSTGGPGCHGARSPRSAGRSPRWRHPPSSLREGPRALHLQPLRSSRPGELSLTLWTSLQTPSSEKPPSPR